MKKPAFTLMGSYLIGWMALLPWIPGLKNQFGLGNPYSAIPTPNLESLLSALRPDVSLIILAVIIGIFFLLRLRRDEPEVPSDGGMKQKQLLLIAGSYFCVAPAVWIASLVGQAIFTQRYPPHRPLGW